MTLQHWQPNFAFSTAKGLVVTLTSAGRSLNEAEGGFGRARLRVRHAGCLARYTGGEGSDFGKDKQDCTSGPRICFETLGAETSPQVIGLSRAPALDVGAAHRLDKPKTVKSRVG